jgi:acyl carrier protein
MQNSSLEMEASSANKPVTIDPAATGLSVASKEIEIRIRNFVARELLFNEKGFPYDDSVSFLEERIIDSLGVLELVTFAGREFGVTVEPSDVTPGNFDSVNALASYIRRKKSPTVEAG